MILEDYLRKYCGSVYPMHMPGHKRNPRFSWVEKPYAIDVTEVPGTDNLHRPDGILRESMELCAKVFGAERAFYLINGSSGGLLSAIHAAVPLGGKVVMSRICHKSVYNGLELRNAEKVFILPERDREFNVSVSITPQQVEDCLCENPDTSLVIITSPTYEGVISDIKGIAEVCHKRGIPLLVDGAHGAHLPFMENNGNSSPGTGCLASYDQPDIIVLSLHKTLPSPTQTSVLLQNGELVSSQKIQESLSVFQTTSPSYILMTGIDRCVGFLAGEERAAAFHKYELMLDRFSEMIKEKEGVRVLCHGSDTLQNHSGIYGFDRGKIIVSANRGEITGFDLDRRLLNEYSIQIEAPFKDYIIAMTSICDTEESLEKFGRGIIEIMGKR